MGMKRQVVLGNGLPEAGVVAIEFLMQRLGQSVLFQVMRQLLIIGHIVEAGVDFLGQQKQPANAIAMLIKGVLLVELVHEPVVVIGPNVLDLKRL